MEKVLLPWGQIRPGPRFIGQVSIFDLFSSSHCFSVIAKNLC